MRSSTANPRTEGLDPYFRAARAARMLEADEERRLIDRAQAGDRAALDALVRSHTPLVLKHALHVARSFRGAPADLVQEGMLGLLEAVRHFDLRKNVRLSTYATWWIRALLLRSVLANWRLVRVGTTKAQRAAFFDLHKEKRLRELQGRPADLSALAARIGVPERELAELEQHLQTPEAALDAPESERGPAVADALLDDEAHRPDTVAEQRELGAQLHSLVGEFGDALPERERKLVDGRWLSAEPRPLRELGDEFGVSGERARQLEASLLKRFRRYARERLEPEPALGRVA
jgi:RNA polymerase sigma-32 factor